MSKVLKAFKFGRGVSILFLIISAYVLCYDAVTLGGLFTIMSKNGVFVFPMSSAIVLIHVAVFVYQLILVKNYYKYKSVRKRKGRVALGDFLSFIGSVSIIPMIGLVFMEIQNGGVDYSLIEDFNRFLIYPAYPLIFYALVTLLVFPIVLAVKNSAYKKAGYEAADAEIAEYIADKQRLDDEKRRQSAQIKQQRQSEIKAREEKLQEEKEQRQRALQEEKEQRRKELQEQTALKAEQRHQKKEQHLLAISQERRQKAEVRYNKVTSFNIVLWGVQFSLLILFTLLTVTLSYAYDITFLILFAIVSWSLMLAVVAVNYCVRLFVKKMKILLCLNAVYLAVLLPVVLLVYIATSFGSSERPLYGVNLSVIVIYLLYVVQIALAVWHLAKCATNYKTKKDNAYFTEHDAELKKQASERKQSRLQQNRELAGLIALYKKKDRAYKDGNYAQAEEISKQIVAYQKQTGLDKASYFDGRLIQLIGYKLLGALLTAITLGIAYPWAMCMVKRWEVVHTVVDGKRLAFNGNGGQLFVKYILWWLLSIVTLGIYSFWLGINITKWVTSHTYDCTNAEMEEYGKLSDNLAQAVRNDNVEDIALYRKQLEEYQMAHDIAGKSKFDGGLLKMIGTNLLSGLITVVTLGICLPWATCIKYNFFVKHTIILGKRQYFDGTGLQLFGQWIKWLLLTVVTLGIYGFWLSISLKKWIVKHTHYVSE